MATQIRPSGNRAGVSRAVRVRARIGSRGVVATAIWALFGMRLQAQSCGNPPPHGRPLQRTRGAPSVSGGALGRGSFAGDAVPKPDSRSDEGYELGGIDPPPAALGHCEKLEGHERALLA